MGLPEGLLRFANFIHRPAQTGTDARKQSADENDERQGNDGEVENGYIHVKNSLVEVSAVT
jgi:hypothetical protein